MVACVRGDVDHHHQFPREEQLIRMLASSVRGAVLK